MLPFTFLALPAPSPEGGGFNPLDVAQGGNFLWTLIIFAVSCPFIWKVVMGPVTRALEQRDARAAQAIEEAKKAAQAAEAARAEVAARLAEARAEAQRTVQEAQARAAAREREMLAQAELQAKGMVEQARRAIQVEQEKALAAIRDEVVDLSILGARAVLQRNAGGEDDRRMVADLVGRARALQKK